VSVFKRAVGFWQSTQTPCLNQLAQVKDVLARGAARNLSTAPSAGRLMGYARSG